MNSENGKVELKAFSGWTIYFMCAAVVTGVISYWGGKYDTEQMHEKLRSQIFTQQVNCVQSARSQSAMAHCVLNAYYTH